MIRVLHVLESSLGGTRRYLEDILAATRGLPLEQGIAYATARADTAWPAFLARAADSGWERIEVPLVRRVSPRDDLRGLLAVRGAIAAFRPDVVHAHSSKAGALARLAVRSLRTRPRILYSPHAIAANMGRVFLYIERALAPLTTRFVAVSESERRELISLDVAPVNRVAVVYPTIDLDAYAPRDRVAARAELGLEPGLLVIGIGRLSPQKDPLRFVDVVARLRERRGDVKAVWLGDGELRGELEREIATRALGETVRVAGWIDDVKPWIAASDVLLSTARYESFGYVVPEAMAMERFVVASRVTGTVDILRDAYERWTYDPSQPDEAVALLDAALRGDAEHETLRRDAREMVRRRFGSEVMRDALARLYAATTASDSGSGSGSGSFSTLSSSNVR